MRERYNRIKNLGIFEDDFTGPFMKVLMWQNLQKLAKAL